MARAICWRSGWELKSVSAGCRWVAHDGIDKYFLDRGSKILKHYRRGCRMGPSARHLHGADTGFQGIKDGFGLRDKWNMQVLKWPHRADHVSIEWALGHTPYILQFARPQNFHAPIKIMQIGNLRIAAVNAPASFTRATKLWLTRRTFISRYTDAIIVEPAKFDCEIFKSPEPIALRQLLDSATAVRCPDSSPGIGRAFGITVRVS